MTVDLSDIPAEAVTAGSEAVYGHRLNYDDRDADGRIACLCGQWREPDDMVGDEYSWGHHVARAVLAAALPIVLASRQQDDETARAEFVTALETELDLAHLGEGYEAQAVADALAEKYWPHLLTQLSAAAA